MHLLLTWYELEAYRTANFTVESYGGYLHGLREHGRAHPPGQMCSQMASNALRAATPKGAKRGGYNFADVLEARRLVETALFAVTPDVWA
jgi:hypothetical protein